MTVSLVSAALVGGLVLVLVRRAVREAGTATPPRAALPFLSRRRPAHEVEADAAERAVRTGHLFADAAHDKLRPMLRDVAASRLRRRGIDLDRDAAAAEVLGPALYELVRPGRPRPADIVAPGVALDELDDHLRRLEAL